MKRFTTIGFLLAANIILAQSESSDFTSTGRGIATTFVTDYHALGINPANLDIPSAYEGKTFTLGLFEIGASVYSEALSKEEVRMNLLREKFVNMTQSEQRAFAKEYANSATSVDFDVMELGMAWQTENAGSFGLSVRERFDYYALLGPQLAEIGVLGFTSPYFENLVLDGGDTIPNTEANADLNFDHISKGITSLANSKPISELIQGTHLKASWIREFNLGYGKTLMSNDDGSGIYAGIGIKALIGNAFLSVDAEGGNAVAYSSLSPVFDIDYGDMAATNPSALPQDSPPLKPVGFGIGIDLGFTMTLHEQWVFSAAVTDIGSMTWDGNVYELNDLNLTEFENAGIESADFYEQITNLNGSDGILEWKGTESRVTPLPTNVRLGAGYKANEWLKVGIDYILPMNEDGIGSLEKPVLAIGGDFAPLPMLRFSLGFIQGGNYDFKIPAGIGAVMGAGTYEVGIASRDMVTFFTEKHPTMSVALGFLRFRF